MSSSSRFSWSSVIPQSVHEVFAWHTRPGAFSRLNDPWRPVRVTRAGDTLEEGAQVSIELPVCGPISIPWHLTHTRYVQDVEFVDEQVRGPFRRWKHSHRFIPESGTSTRMVDEIEYTLLPGCGIGDRFLKQQLARLFSFRHAILHSDLELHARWSSKPRKTIVIAGASGFVGRALEAFLTTAGHTVRKLVRREPQGPLEQRWDPERGVLPQDVFTGADALVVLSGENIAQGRWTTKRKLQIKKSRVDTTELLAACVSALPKPLEVVISASGVGIYGDTHDTEVDENGPVGRGFLAEVGHAWEEAAKPIEQSGTRLVTLRLGTVLNATGGALHKMIPPFLCGIGGPLGAGTQWMSWIAMQDLLGIIEHALYTHELKGPVNAVSPTPCTNRDFAKALGSVLRRPAVVPTPAFALKAIFGEMAQELLLSNMRIVPQALMKSGYQFVLSDLSRALRFECGLVAGEPLPR